MQILGTYQSATSMEKDDIKYEEAVSELEAIVRKMENDELDIDELGQQLKRAQLLIRLCHDKLTRTDEEIKTILEGPSAD